MDFDPLPLREALIAWYGAHGRRLPWRETRDPYPIWVSEVMLQQTQVKTVIPYYHRWLAALPGIAALAAADPAAVLKLWEGLGYYSRARNVQRAARLIVERHDGTFPRTFAEVVALPGIGRSTAGAILSAAFDQPWPILDANVRRVLSRLVAHTGSEATLWHLSETLLDRNQPYVFNQALMDLGATVCLPRKPLCLFCPWRPSCRAHALGAPERYGGRPARPSRPLRRCAGALIERRGVYLLVQRPEEGLLAGLWEFPTLELQADEDPRTRLTSAFGARFSLERFLGTVTHAYTHLQVEVSVFAGCWRDTHPPDTGGRPFAWVGPAEWKRYALPAIAHKMAALL